jgi:hypothetical protein
LTWAAVVEESVGGLGPGEWPAAVNGMNYDLEDQAAK